MKLNKLTRIAAVWMCLCLITVSGCGRNDMSDTTGELSRAEYPEVVQYPKEEDFRDADGSLDCTAYDEAYVKWRADSKSRVRQSEGYKDGMEEFCYTTMKEFLSGAGDDNRVYSPLNVYMALSMLAEVTDGNSRAQILNLLEAEDVEALRDKACNLWRANYNDDGTVTSVLANSLWLNENIGYEQDTMSVLAERYYASSYTGKMGSDEFNKVFQSWLNEQTKGLLKEQAESIELDSDTILALASTIYFKARWSETFMVENTQEDTFHSASGDIDCEFMHQSRKQYLYWGDKFTCVNKGLENSGSMWLVLPDEGVSIDELLEDEAVMDMIMDASAWQDKKELMVNLSMPKFDVSSDIELSKGLMELGITDVFDSGMSDFSALTKATDNIVLSEAKHAARVMADEEGCIATAFTVMAVTEAAIEIPPDEEIDFVLDRPFLFVITGADGTPIFAGVVNQPS